MEKCEPGKPQVTPEDPEHRGSARDPEERKVHKDDVKEKTMDKTLADSFPTSDPPSSIPDPASDCFAEGDTAESPYDRLPHAGRKDTEKQPLPGDQPFDRQPQPGGKDKAA